MNAKILARRQPEVAQEAGVLRVAVGPVPGEAGETATGIGIGIGIETAAAKVAGARAAPA
jgi:hypothetical protein